MNVSLGNDMEKIPMQRVSFLQDCLLKKCTRYDMKVVMYEDLHNLQVKATD